MTITMTPNQGATTPITLGGNITSLSSIHSAAEQDQYKSAPQSSPKSAPPQAQGGVTAGAGAISAIGGAGSVRRMRRRTS
jgi:hypothetical protein